MTRLRLVAAMLGVAVCGWVSEASAQSDLPAPRGALFAVLSGAHVCNLPQNNDPPLCRLGDPDGTGSATVLITGPTSLCGAVVVRDLDFSDSSFPRGANIYFAQASYTGQRVARLAVPKANGNGNPGTSMACDNAVSEEIIERMQRNPEFFYITVHGQGLRYGALRGQLF